MNRSIEAIPTWSLCYIINGDASGLTDEEIRMVDEAIRKNNIEIISPRYNEEIKRITSPHSPNRLLYNLCSIIHLYDKLIQLILILLP